MLEKISLTDLYVNTPDNGSVLFSLVFYDELRGLRLRILIGSNHPLILMLVEDVHVLDDVIPNMNIQSSFHDLIMYQQ